MGMVVRNCIQRTGIQCTCIQRTAIRADGDWEPLSEAAGSLDKGMWRPYLAELDPAATSRSEERAAGYPRLSRYAQARAVLAQRSYINIG